MDPSSLGETFRRQRLALDKTLRDIAGSAGVSPAYLSQIERGERTPSPRSQAVIAEALGLSVEDLTRDQALSLEVRSLFQVRGQRSTQSLRSRPAFQKAYALLGSCSTVCSAPGTFAWAGQFNGTNGGLELLCKTPSRVYVGLKSGGAGGLTVERRLVFNPTLDVFEEVKYQGDTASLWQEFKEPLIADLLNGIKPGTDVRRFINEKSVVIVSEVPLHRGWDLSGAQAAAMAATLACELNVVDNTTIKAWAARPCSELLTDPEFLKVARLAVKIQCMSHATASGGGTAVCPLIGNTVNPLVYVSEARDGHYRAPTPANPEKCTDSADPSVVRPRAVGTHFEVIDSVAFSVWRLEELPGAGTALSLEETVDYGLLYPGDPDPPASKILSVAAKKDELAEIAHAADIEWFKDLPSELDTRFRFLALCRTDDARRLLGLCYTDPILCNAMEVLSATISLMRRGHSGPALDRLYSSIGRNHWLGWNLGIETPVANEIWSWLQWKVRRLDHAPGIGASIAGSERGGDIFFVCRWHGLRDLMPEIVAELRKFTGEKVELDYASWIDGVEKDGLRVEDPSALGRVSTQPEDTVASTHVPIASPPEATTSLASTQGSQTAGQEPAPYERQSKQARKESPRKGTKET